MDENTTRSFILNNCLAAVSAIPLENSTIATDGFNNLIYSFDTNGVSTESTTVSRPYQRLRENGGGYTALQGCNNPTVYFLNENFSETDFIRLDISSNSRCSNSNGGFGEITDASVASIGSEKFIVGAFRTKAYLFDMNGKKLTRLCETDEDELLTDFIYNGEGVFAMSTLQNKTRTVTVSDNGITKSSVLEKGHTLRMLMFVNNDIYGLFGKGYLHNRIIRIYSDGCLTLP